MRPHAGHSSDHQVVWDAATATAFTGDLWLGVRARTLHSTEDPYAIVESLRTIRALGPDRLFDAHRGLVSRPAAALKGRADWLSKTIDEIAGRIAEGESDAEIVKRVLRGDEIAAAVSRGEYARLNLVRAVRRRVAGGTVPTQ